MFSTAFVLFFVSVGMALLRLALNTFPFLHIRALERANYVDPAKTERAKKKARVWRARMMFLFPVEALLGLVEILACGIGLLAANQWLGAPYRYFAPYDIEGVAIWCAWCFVLAVLEGRIQTQPKHP